MFLAITTTCAAVLLASALAKRISIDAFRPMLIERE
jgi:hypothetical protein